MTKPFIKLFKTPNNYYVFDVNHNEIISVSDISFNYLSDVANGSEVWNPNVNEELSELNKEGYLECESFVKEIRHGYTNNLKYILGRKTNKITLQLTQDCNFRCKYCIYSEQKNIQQRTHSRKRMSWETARKAIDYLWEHSVDSPKVNIGFYGGEPLLEFPLIKKVVEYCDIKFSGKSITYNITTNGTLLNEEMIQYFNEHDITMMISLDGSKEVNDKNRVFIDGRGTYNAVIKAIETIKRVSPDYYAKLTIGMVVNPNSDYDCFNSINIVGQTLEKLNIMANILDQEYDDQETYFSDENAWEYGYQQFLAILAYYKRVSDNKVSSLFNGMMQTAVNDDTIIVNAIPLMSADAPSGPCIPGQGRLFVSVEEKLFPCERVSENSSATCIGNLSDGINVEQASNILNVGALTDSECKTCWAFRYCTLCVKKSDDGEGLSSSKRLSRCSEARSSAFNKISLHLLLKEVLMYYQEQIRL